MKTYQISVRSDVYEAPHQETGEACEHLNYYVIAEDQEGRRWAHNCGWTTEKYSRMVAGVHAWALANRVKLAQERGQWIGVENGCWYRIDPCYGSSAYVLQEAIELDRRQEYGN